MNHEEPPHDTVADGAAPTAATADSIGDAATIAASDDAAGVAKRTARTAAGRTVVLPRRAKTTGATASASGESVEWSVDDHPRFETLEALGEGGMGEVALVMDQDIHRKVAIKRLHAEQQSPTALLRFAEEVRVVGALEHPGIVPVHDVGIDERGQHYAVMKYLEGETMESVIERLKAGSPEHLRRFSYDYRAQVFAKVCEAVRFAHERGIIHRDLKPANIMIGPYGEVTVVDWGIAKRIGSKDDARASDATASSDDDRLVRTRVGSLIGTPLYMSPEQAAGKNDALDERSDIFSLCMVFYEFLALEHPLADKRTVEQVILALIHEEWDHLKLRLPALSKGVPCELLRVLQKGIYREPVQALSHRGRARAAVAGHARRQRPARVLHHEEQARPARAHALDRPPPPMRTRRSTTSRPCSSSAPSPRSCGASRGDDAHSRVGDANSLLTHFSALFTVSLKLAGTRTFESTSPPALAESIACGSSSSAAMSSSTSTQRPSASSTEHSLCNIARRCCACRESTSLAVFTSVLKAL
jgi:serine/threonine protein kinase